MHIKKVFLIAVSILFAQACHETSDNTLGHTNASLECLTFQDTSFSIYAMTTWDVDHNGCLTPEETSQVTKLPANAFAGNTALQNLNDLNNFPNLTVIGAGAFAGCTGLTTVSLPNVTTVGQGAFAGCTNLSSIQLPAAASIAADAFDGCTKLPVSAQPCPNGLRKCSDDTHEVSLCKNGQWVANETCADGCTNGFCNGQIPPKPCAQGTMKCSDDNTAVQLCKNDKWIPLTTCPNGCTDGMCNANGNASKTCTEGALKCLDEPRERNYCRDGKWTYIDSCTSGCTNGVCDEVIYLCTNDSRVFSYHKNVLSEIPSYHIQTYAEFQYFYSNSLNMFQPVSDEWDSMAICQAGEWFFLANEHEADNCDIYHNMTFSFCSEDQKFVVRCTGNDTKPIEITACNSICVLGKCIDPKPGDSCSDTYDPYAAFTHICNSEHNKVLWCNYDRTWITYADCFYGCTNRLRESLNGYGYSGGYTYAVIPDDYCPSKPCTINGDFKCSDDNSQSLICQNGEWLPQDTCQYGCYKGKCKKTEWGYCGNQPAINMVDAEDLALNPDDIEDRVYEDRLYTDEYIDLLYYIKERPNGLFDDFCAQYDAIGACYPEDVLEKSGQSIPDIHHSCLKPCTKEEVDNNLLECQGNDDMGLPGDFITMKHKCRPIGDDMYAYIPTGHVLMEDCIDDTRGDCSAFGFEPSYAHGYGYWWIPKGCKASRAECPPQCNGYCNFDGTECICGDDCDWMCAKTGKCINCPYSLDATGKCIYPDYCPETCEDGCWDSDYFEPKGTCFDSSICDNACEYKYIGPGHWGMSCEFEECYRWYPYSNDFG